MKSLGARRAAGMFPAVLLIVGCSYELAPSPLGTVVIQESPAWPDTLYPGELATVVADPVSAAGVSVRDVRLIWSSSDSSVLRVEQPVGVTSGDGGTEGRFALVYALRPGEADIVVRLDQWGFAAAELRAPVVVSEDGWPHTVTVGDVDTIAVRLDRADLTAVGPLRFSWSSSDPAILQVTPLAGDSSQAALTARAGGAAQLTLALSGPRVARQEFQQGLVVNSLKIEEQAPWPDLLPVNGTAQLAVTVSDPMGTPRPGVTVTWSSTNVSAFVVDANGVLTALRRGGGEIVARVGSPPFEVSEYRAAFQVVEKWQSVSAGGAHSCAITSTDGSGYCWGDNTSGQLGLAIGATAPALRPSRVVTFRRFNQLEAGGSHSCGREGTANLLCWGSRHQAQLGDGWCPSDAGTGGLICTDLSPGPASIVLDGQLGGAQVAVVDISSGGAFTCIENGLLYRYSGSPTTETLCWGTINGSIFSGGLTLATVADSALSHEEAVRPAAGGFHVCVLGRGYSGLPEQSVFCAGLNDQGQLGDGTTIERADLREPFITDDPTLPPSLPPMSGVTAGLNHTCAWNSYSAWCWGSNADDQLGAVSSDLCSRGPCSLRPIESQMSGSIETLSAGDAHTCALTTSGEAWCWGANSRGQLGRGGFGGSFGEPQPVAGGHVFESISAGGAHTCGVTSNGSIFCWGANEQGQLGDGTRDDRASPTRVVEGS
jgi:alpha-tubulin suppressor-like RCC1 family protein